MSARPYQTYWTPDLEGFANDAWEDPPRLLVLLAELSHRTRPRAMLLRSKIAMRIAALEREGFRWPSTRASGGDGDLSSSVFRYQRGLLNMLGYKTGLQGLDDLERLEILDFVYTKPLPRMLAEEYVREWGAPRSAQRLQKLAESIAAFARNAKRRTAQDMSTAISEWEADLAYLKVEYYDRRYDFGWPHTTLR